MGKFRMASINYSYIATFIFVIVFFAFAFFSVFEIPVVQLMAMLGMGYFLWSLTEYLVNRGSHLFTKREIPFIGLPIDYHYRHHKDPGDIRYIFMHPLLICCLVSTNFISAYLIFGDLALPLLSGFILGYLLFVLLHALQHRYPAPRIGFLKTLWQNHFLHHSYYPDLAFGVSTWIWDYVFNTLPPRHLFYEVKPAGARPVDTSINAIEVNDKKTADMFLGLPRIIYRDDLNCIPPLKTEIARIFDHNVNPYFNHGVAKRWIVVNKTGEVVGRIAAFVNFEKMHDGDEIVGGIGFFECTDDRDVALLLFNTAANWLERNFQATAVDGPVNFGENDKYWGLLVKGFKPPSYGMNYNPPYYVKFFESYGFKPLYKQLTNAIDLHSQLPERFTRIAERIISNEQYSFQPFRYDDRELFVRDFSEVYNKAWSSFSNFRPINEGTIRESLRELKPIMEEDFIWFAYSGNQPIGFLLAVPDVNPVLKRLGGNLNWFGKLKFIYHKYATGFSRVRVVVMGIVPEFQNRGVESGLIYHAYNEGVKRPAYKQVELSWVGDFNEKMIAIHKAMGAKEDKQHVTYRKKL